MIEFSDVTKKFRKTIAINDLSLKISDNGIYCLLGKNGAGKTTFMKLLAGQIAANTGQIIVDGQVVSPARMPISVNFIESGSVQFNMTVSELIKSAASLQTEFDRDFAREMVGKFGLSLDKRYKTLSLGMKIMLTTIITLANNSKIILLDEPVLGFDAIIRNQFNSLLLESYQNKPRIIIISTHLIDEIAKVTDKLIIINDGKILLQTDMIDIDEHAYTLIGSEQIIIPLLSELNCINKTKVGNMVAAHIYDKRITLPNGVRLDKLTLQDFFIKYVGGDYE